MAEALTATQLGKVTKLLETQQDLIAKLHDCTREIDNILGGKASIGEILKRLERAFDAAWCARYARGASGRYVWNYTQDRAQWKRLVKSIDVDDLERRIVRYIRNDDQFYVKERHPFRFFAHSVNQWADQGDAPDGFDLDGSPVVGCSHQPPCTSDAEHTRRRRSA